MENNLHKLSNTAQVQWRIAVANGQDAERAWNDVRRYCPGLLALGVVVVYSREAGALVECPIPSESATGAHSQRSKRDKIVPRCRRECCIGLP